MIKINNLTKVYKSKHKNDCIALNNISFELPDKALVFIIGKSGSGKSTLLNIVGGLDNATKGKISVFNNEITSFNENNLFSYRSSLIGFIFQDFHLLDHLTVKDNILMSLKLLNQNDEMENDKLLTNILKEVDLVGYENRYPTELSGGQRQRVAIARALIKNPNVILADEPTGNLDSNTTLQIIKLLKKISENRLVIIVSHNLFDAYEYADRIIELSNGKIINDLEVNKDYLNEIQIVDNEIILPMLKKFNQNELDILLESSKHENITKIVQNDKKFIKYDNRLLNNTKIDIPNNKLNIKEIFKLSYNFGKYRLFNFILSAFMAAIVLVVIALAQSIAYYNPYDTIANELDPNNNIYVIKQTNSDGINSNKINSISDKDIEEFNTVIKDDKYYKLYLENIYTAKNYNIIYGREYSFSGDAYLTETLGTLETTEEFAKKLLKQDELNIYTNNTPYKPNGIYITDYIADAMIYYETACSYDDVLGQVYESEIWTWGYINGIILTGYKEKYKNELNELANNTTKLTEEAMDFYDYIILALGVGYTFEEDYRNIVCNDISVRNFYLGDNLTINGISINKNVNWIVQASYHNINLNDDEIIISYKNYNEIFGTSYNPSNLDTFISHKAVIKTYLNNNETIYEKEVTIKAINNNISSSILASDCIFKESKYALFGTYAFYIENVSNEIVSYALENDYISNSIKMQAVQTMTKAVEVFNKLFNLIEIILIVALTSLLISFSIKNIQTNMYEIGVLKSLGCKFKNLALIFILHTLVIIILIIILSTLGFLIFSNYANHILVVSLKQLAPHRIMLELQFIKFNIKLISLDNLLMILISIISIFIPMLKLKQINPIQIIKAKE